MISDDSDDPDEDADNLNDDDLMAGYIGNDEPANGVEPRNTESRQEWPYAVVPTAAPAVGGEAQVWFRQHHADWHVQVALVLRAWMDANPRQSPPTDISD